MRQNSLRFSRYGKSLLHNGFHECCFLSITSRLILLSKLFSVVGLFGVSGVGCFIGFDFFLSNSLSKGILIDSLTIHQV